jgi:hypothetical protein
MSSGIGQAPAIEPAHAAEQEQATGQAHATALAHATARQDQLPPMTAEAARRLAAALAPHWRAMRVVTAGTPYGSCPGTDQAAADPGAGDPAAASTAAASTAAASTGATRPAATGPPATGTGAAAQLPPASAATTIFIAGMLERLSA